MRTEYFGKFDYQKNVFEIPKESVQGGLCTLDGVEIKSVWFADTVAGVLKTYDVLRDGRVATAVNKAPDPDGFTRYRLEDFPGREMNLPPGGVISETLRGEVRVFGPDK